MNSRFCRRGGSEDPESAAGGSNTARKDAKREAAVGGEADCTQRRDDGIAAVTERKRSRGSSSATAQILVQCAPPSRDDRFSGERVLAESSLPFPHELSETEEECAACGRVGEAACMAPRERRARVADSGNEQGRDPSDEPASFETASENCAAATERDGESIISPRVITLYVPTMFTTAAGRPICVREKRVMDSESPYWSLLRFAPGREAALSSSSTDRNETPGIGEGTAPIDDSPLLPEGSTSRAGSFFPGCGDGQATKGPLISSHLGARWLQPRPLRASSCPERCHASSGELPKQQAVYVLPAFTGFCAANGRPLFLSSGEI